MRPAVALWLTADRDGVVVDGDPRSAFLLAGAGCDIPPEELRRLGVDKIEAALGVNLEPVVQVVDGVEDERPVDSEPGVQVSGEGGEMVEPEPEPEKQADPPEDKQVEKPADKAVKAPRREKAD